MEEGVGPFQHLATAAEGSVIVVQVPAESDAPQWRDWRLVLHRAVL
jgi:hypothetical protein